jgi:hypothetical protein
MDTTFKSKVDWWYYVLILIAIIVGALTLSTGNLWAGGVAFVALLLMLHILFTTYYVITSDSILQVRCGFFPKKEIPIAEIGALERTIIPLFSYSLSLNRLIVWKDKMMWMLVSPRNEKEFIRLLKTSNPDIQLINDDSVI